MKFLAVFVTLAAVAAGFPATTTWTLNELSNAIQSPGTDPNLLPFLEAALNEMMLSLHQGQPMQTITIAMPTIAEYTLHDLSVALQSPSTNPAHIPVLEDALNQYMADFFAGIDNPSITVVLPPVAETDFIDVWPIQAPEEEHNLIDVWPVVVPEVPAAPAAPVEEAIPSSPLVQIIVNVQKEGSDVPSSNVIDVPLPVQVVDGPAWGNFIEAH